MKQRHVTYYQLNTLAQHLAIEIKHKQPRPTGSVFKVYPVPRGGISAALALSAHLPIFLVEQPHIADIIVDDLIDSGATKERLNVEFPHTPFYALIDKRDTEWGQSWVVFPWEINNDAYVDTAEDNIRRLLQFVGENPKRGGLLETPHRVTKAWKYWCSGYGQDVGSIFKVFEDGAEKHDQMVTVADLPIYSHCEHHMAPIIGTVTIGYIPNGKIIGLSKLSRLADVFALRLQVQERMTDQIADAIQEHLEPVGVGVCIKARHLCMESRGVCKQGHHTITTALRGAIKDEPSARAEFLQLAR